jgi:predicted dehydrogenase
LHASKRFGFEQACTRVEEVMENAAVQLVFISTRHDSHAELACRALRAGKHVWVEKPAALTLEELAGVVRALREAASSRLVVGFNRPFSPLAQWLLGRVSSMSPRLMQYRVNAGFVPPDSWLYDPRVGGGRLLGEGCHFFDFLRHASGAGAKTVTVTAPGESRVDLPDTGNFAATIEFQNGCIGQLLYSAQGSARMAKERFECFAGETCGTLDDYRDAEFFQRDRQERHGRQSQDKGQASLLDAFVQSLIRGTGPPMRAEDIIESSLITLAAQQSLETRQPVALAGLRKFIA